uniref:Pso c2 allergen n=1 Tax=Psoroptes ovis TaxID=83912 RepID=A0A1U9J731_PSOOV|nr:Pso c2 allergen [Psoroptes ovis]
MMRTLVVLAITLAVVSAGKVKFQDCGKGEVESLEVEGCSGDYCVIHKGKKLDLAISVTSNQDSANLKLDIVADINGVQIEVPGVDHDGCHYVKCPIKKGQHFDVKYTYSIPAILPTTKAKIIAKIIGDKGLGGCIVINGEIQD